MKKKMIVTMLAAGGIALVVNGIELFLKWYALSPRGSMALQQASVFFVLPFVAAVLLVPAAAVLALFPRPRRFAVSMLLASILFVGITLAVRAAVDVRARRFRALAERSEPLVEAIRQYTADKGEPPDNLEALVPQYIEKIPGTDMGAYPEYRYERADSSRQWHGNPWVLYVETPLGILNWDIFLYYPEQNYPEYAFGGSIERMRKWAYIHE
ncbi:MAG: hypothetical protein GF333_01115 [Candidatus Omnitrophica bacterium]|nr:hypothetical protein [Candidatus Omnitrophota bacterium]